MTYRWNKLAKLSALAACCSVVVWISSTSAKEEETSVLVKKPDASATQTHTDQGPVLPPPANPRAASDTYQSPDLFAPKQPAESITTQPLPPAPTPTQPRTNSTVKRPFMRPAQPLDPARGQLTTQSEPMPAPAGVPLPESAPPVERPANVRPAPPIVYDTDHDARKMFRTGQIQLVMVTQDPSDGCLYEIPLCIPACCTGEPRIKGGRGLFGRGNVEYCWPCGFKAQIKFRHVLGDVKVEYEGD
jgi:hypothetical protein